MGNMYNYSDSEMLTFLLDGELDASLGQELLRKIEIDAELNKQMEDEMQIKTCSSLCRGSTGKFCSSKR